MNARDYAIFQLDRTFLPGWQSRTIDFRFAGPNPEPTDPRDVDLAEQIVVGVVKNLIFLQRLVQHYSGRTMRSISEPIQKILAAGIYQIRELNRVPAPAVVFETVEQSRRFGYPQAAGFVNAIMRKCADKPREMPHFGNDPAEEALIIHSHQKVVFRKYCKLVGAKQALEICKFNNRIPPIVVRLIGQTTVEDLVKAGIDATAHAAPGMAIVRAARREDLAKMARERMGQVQDSTSAAVVGFMDLQPGMTVLDRCCGRGTKTLQILDGVGPEGKIVAIDPDARRVESLRRSIDNRGVKNITPVVGRSLADAAAAINGMLFDRILVDAPCSNSGVFARRPEARYHQTDREMDSLKLLQQDMLKDVVKVLKPGGKLCYSTCSVWRDENEKQIKWLLANVEGLELEKEQTTLPIPTEDPTQYRDGGYVAIVKKKA